MIAYLFFYKTKFYFRELKTPWKALLTVFLLFIAWVYGRIFSEIYNRLLSGELDFISSETFLNLSITAVAIVTGIRMFLPDYKPLVPMFPKYYPLSKISRYIISLINDFYKPFFLYMLLFIFSGSYYAEISKTYFLFGTLLAMVSAHLARRTLQYAIDFHTKINWRFIHGLAVLTIAYYISIFFISTLNLVLQFSIVAAVFLVLGFLQESAIQSQKMNRTPTKSRHLSLSLKLLWSNKKVRLPLLVAFGFKLVVLLVNFFLYKIEGTNLFENQMILWLFISPAMIYTYVFHNVWGFWKDLWLTMELRSGNYNFMIRQLMRLISIPLAIDLLITTLILLVPGKDVGFILLFYLTTSLFLLTQSFFWSLLTPKKIGSSFQMRGNVSQGSILVSMAGILVLAMLKNSQWFYYLIPGFVVISGIALWLSFHLYREKKYIIFRKLLKE